MAGLARPVSLRRSSRARRLSLRVSETKAAAVLTLPSTVNLREAGDFLAAHFDWLQKHLARLPQAVPFDDGARIPLRGVEHELRLAPQSGGRSKVLIEPGCSSPAPGNRSGPELPSPQMRIAAPPDKAAVVLSHWLRREARSDISERVAIHATGLNVAPKRITIRDQTTRWGSCSATGTLSFSWRLVLAPPLVLDYVAAHEVAHLRELNHGTRFWRLVHKAAPRSDEARAWLKEHGPRLHRYGATD